jgi:hypothetical protein
MSGARGELRSILERRDDDLARAFATYRTEFSRLLADAGAVSLSERGKQALGHMHDRTHALRAEIADVQPRIHEADVLIDALRSYDKGLLGLRVALAGQIDRERAARIDRAARRMQRGSATVERVWRGLQP